MAYGKDICAALWTEALQSQHGVAITPEDEDLSALRRELYKTRESLMDARLHTLNMFVSPDGKELWLCKKQENHSGKLP